MWARLEAPGFWPTVGPGAARPKDRPGSPTNYRAGEARDGRDERQQTGPEELAELRLGRLIEELPRHGGLDRHVASGSNLAATGALGHGVSSNASTPCSIPAS